jgi:hypothetical protein
MNIMRHLAAVGLLIAMLALLIVFALLFGTSAEGFRWFVVLTLTALVSISLFIGLRRFGRLALIASLMAMIAMPWSYAAGLWQGLPIVGETSYCVGYSGYPTGVTQPTINPSTPNNCNATAPAGPGALSGNEVNPADIPTNTGGGPSSVLIPIPSEASGAYVYFSSLTLQGTLEVATSSIAIPNLITNVIVDPTGTLTAFTATLPSAPLDGQIVRLISSQQITPTLVITAASALTTVKNAPVSFSQLANASATFAATSLPFSASFIYDLAKNTWFRF